MLWKHNTLGVTKSDILKLINIVKTVSAINSNNNLNDAAKSKEVFDTLNNVDTIVDDCDIINRDLINVEHIDDINIIIIPEL